jgi:hypothetical protein
MKATLLVWILSCWGRQSVFLSAEACYREVLSVAGFCDRVWMGGEEGKESCYGSLQVCTCSKKNIEAKE